MGVGRVETEETDPAKVVIYGNAEDANVAWIGAAADRIGQGLMLKRE